MFESWDYDPDAVPVRSGHFIAGGLVEDRPAIEVRRPSDGVVYAAIPEAGEEGVDRAVAAARKAFQDCDWARIEPRRRARILRRWADLLEKQADELAVLESLGSTRPVADARAWDVPFAAESLRFFAEYADKLGARQDDWLFLTGELTYTRRVAGEIFRIPMDKQTHSERLFVTDKWGTIRGNFAWNKLDQVTALKAELDKLLAETEKPAEA